MYDEGGLDAVKRLSAFRGVVSAHISLEGKLSDTAVFLSVVRKQEPWG